MKQYAEQRRKTSKLAEEKKIKEQTAKEKKMVKKI